MAPIFRSLGFRLRYWQQKFLASKTFRPFLWPYKDNTCTSVSLRTRHGSGMRGQQLPTCVWRHVTETSSYSDTERSDVNKKSTRIRVFLRMRRFITAESISTKFCIYAPWANVVIFLNRRPNWLRGFGRVKLQNVAFLIDFGVGF